MLAEGVSRFCEDASLDPTSLTVLIVAWKFKAATQCEFTRKEFVDGMADLGLVCVCVYSYVPSFNSTLLGSSDIPHRGVILQSKIVANFFDLLLCNNSLQRNTLYSTYCTLIVR